MMDATIEQYKEIMESNVYPVSNNEESKIFEPQLEKDSLVFHGVAFDKLEEDSKDDDASIKKNLIEHKIRTVMKSEWGLDCKAAFKHVFR